MDDDPETVPQLGYLKVLVTVLTVTMIAGFLVIVTLFVIRFRAPPPIALPEGLAMPEGVAAASVTLGDDWVGVLTGADEFLVFDRRTGALRGRMPLR